MGDLVAHPRRVEIDFPGERMVEYATGAVAIEIVRETDEEKQEMRQGDERAREILEREEIYGRRGRTARPDGPGCSAL